MGFTNNPMQSHGIHWNSLEIIGNPMESHRIDGNPLVIPWDSRDVIDNPMKSHGIHWNSLIIQWSCLDPTMILRDCMEFELLRICGNSVVGNPIEWNSIDGIMGLYGNHQNSLIVQ